MQKILTVEDIRKEPLIRKKWGFQKTNPSTYPKEILITGASSYVGTHVVRLLQAKHPVRVHLLIRAGSMQEAGEKMQNAFSSWELGDFRKEQFTIHPGDICKSMMGLSNSRYAFLNENIGFVLHLAMNPLYHLPYAHFKRLWLPELSRMINFCGDKKYPKSLHYPSSFNSGFFTDNDDFQQLNNNAWQSGYAGFKWVAYKMIENAFNQNLNGCIYDIPQVLGTIENGLCPRQYPIWHILDIFLKTKCYIPFQLKVVSIDVLSEVIVQNIMADQNNKGLRFIRPVLSPAVSDEYFGKMVASLLGLFRTEQELMREKCQDPKHFDFIFPQHFCALLNKVTGLPPVFPDNYDMDSLPSTMTVFLSSLNNILAHQNTNTTRTSS